MVNLNTNYKNPCQVKFKDVFKLNSVEEAEKHLKNCY